MVGPSAAGALGDTVAGVTLRVHISSKSFPTDRGELQVLGQIDLTLGAREIVALVGPSGCGKTTLLRIIGGLETQFQGTVDWLGAGIPRIGTVFQEPRLLPWRTVRQNLLLVQQAANHDLVDTLLQTMDLDAFRDAFPATLSLGMARRIAIARALAIEPELVLLDEPFVSLDPATAARTRALLIAAWRQRPTAALLVTHDRAEATSLADRIIFLSERPTRILTETVVPDGLRRQPDVQSTA